MSDNQPMPHQQNTSVFRQVLRAAWLLAGIVFGVALLVYINTLNHAFVFDDNGEIEQNYYITSPAYLPRIFSTGFWSFLDTRNIKRLGNYYRPLKHVYYMGIHLVWGAKPFGFHLASILFHALVSALLFFYILEFTREHMSAFWGAMIFAVHPVHTEAVAWISSIPHIGCLFWIMFTSFIYLKTREPRFRRLFDFNYVLAALGFLAALLTHEIALLLPLALVVHDFLSGRFRNNPKAWILEAANRYALLVLAGGIYIFMRIHALSDFAPSIRHAQLSRFEYYINVFPLLKDYFVKLLWPYPLQVWYTFQPVHTIWSGTFLFSLVGIALFLSLGLYLWKKQDKTMLFGMAWMVIFLIPVLNIKALGENIFCERYLYIPSLGFSLVISGAMARLYAHRALKRFAKTVGLFLVLLAVLLGASTIDRNRVWKNNEILYTTTLKQNPRSDYIRINLGTVYLDRKKWALALREFEIVKTHNYNLRSLYPNLGIAYQHLGRREEAEREYRMAIKTDPYNVKSRLNLGVICERTGRDKEAIRLYREIIKLDPGHFDSRFNLAAVYYRHNLIPEAIKEYRLLLKNYPADNLSRAQVHFNLGVIYAKLGLGQEAMQNIWCTLQLDPGNYRALGFLQKNQERPAKSLESK
ncbi:tetratricopeptide repeat protein [bacterium]|nr:tetratricopeptide repeat protein [bacterium]